MNLKQKALLKIEKEEKENCTTDTHEIIYEAERRVGKKI